MPIIKVDTFEEAQQRRGEQIDAGGGCLLIDASLKAETVPLIEKLIDGEPFKGEPIGEIKWKGLVRGEDEDTGEPATLWIKRPLILVVGDKSLKVLDEIEKLVPGFIAKFGPVK
jgi:hypothetical protein